MGNASSDLQAVVFVLVAIYLAGGRPFARPGRSIRVQQLVVHKHPLASPPPPPPHGQTPLSQPPPPLPRVAPGTKGAPLGGPSSTSAPQRPPPGHGR